ncbi:cupin domain-containing protein [Silvimonas amylolytica]|uniref:Transcriptional regulator n=1 Tax=Silvimonas amylolytica TaxID=449663 RepID=A0ABQ2PGE4_9NEIS|nr:cupin domain-containing protein [Silvimonas amylolytica]GGP24270.1 transcriptional regulator [Silvimonas amylolytica]
MKVIAFSNHNPQPVIDFPRPERLVSGNPQRTTWLHYDNAANGFSSGIWASEVGSWRIEFGPAEEEFFSIIEGRARVYDEAGAFAEVGPGEALVIPAGFKGRFEVLEPVKKYFAIYEKAAS